MLDRVTFQHPFLERSILGVLATYVTADTGTGAVHTAPSHGADDFYTGQRYGLDPTSRVDAGGHIHVDPAAWHSAQPPAFDGMKVWAANPVIVAMLEERGALLGGSQLEHSYPALLALPPSRHLPRHRAVVHRPRNPGEARATAQKQRFGSSPSRKSTRWSGTRPGARSASPT